MWQWSLWLILACACTPSVGTENPAPTEEPTSTIVQPKAAPSTASRTTAPPQLTAPPGIEILVAPTVEDYEDVDHALAAAIEAWETAAADTYAYQIRIDCDCHDRGEAWIRKCDADLA